MTEPLFEDRRAGGIALAELLTGYAGRDDVMVLALPRGGVPVAREVARALGAPLDVLVVRKLGAPGREELAMGAIATGGARVLNEAVIRALGVDAEQLRAETEHQQMELGRRERAYRGDRPWPELAGRTLIVVDDGFATGATMKAAVRALRLFEPREILVAVPVAPDNAEKEMSRLADRFIAVATPADFVAVGRWYRDFEQTTDDEVRQLLAQAAED
ncbi:MAG: phosphoribosyltransferase [Gammaproteobacteria bacterium]|nr:phosphoribosyltransferase [Gammaproteobacteria bacterium]